MRRDERFEGIVAGNFGEWVGISDNRYQPSSTFIWIVWALALDSRSFAHEARSG